MSFHNAIPYRCNCANLFLKYFQARPFLLLKKAATCSCLVTKNIRLRSDFQASTPISSAYRHGASYSAELTKSLKRKPGDALTRSRSSCQSRIWSTTVGGRTDGGTPACGLAVLVMLCLRICGCACVDRYETIWSAVMPISTARRIDWRVTLPVIRFGKRYLSVANRAMREIWSGDEVYAYIR